MRWFNGKEMALLGWPTCSSDIYSIEDLWKILPYKVYANNRMFNTVDELMEANDSFWHDIPIKRLPMLTEGMQNRCTCIIKEQGGSIKY